MALDKELGVESTPVGGDEMFIIFSFVELCRDHFDEYTVLDVLIFYKLPVNVCVVCVCVRERECV